MISKTKSIIFLLQHLKLIFILNIFFFIILYPYICKCGFDTFKSNYSKIKWKGTYISGPYLILLDHQACQWTTINFLRQQQTTRLYIKALHTVWMCLCPINTPKDKLITDLSTILTCFSFPIQNEYYLKRTNLVWNLYLLLTKIDYCQPACLVYKKCNTILTVKIYFPEKKIF